jgi:site-specific DNA recombinase
VSSRRGVEVVFLNRPLGQSPEDDLLLQVQGIVAEYERAKIMERSRRGKKHAAQSGSLNVMSGAPSGYRYISVREGDGQARFEPVAEQARVVQQIFTWIGRDRCSLAEVCRRLHAGGMPSATGKTIWSREAVWHVLQNPAYMGQAAYRKTHMILRGKNSRLRAARGHPTQPRRVTHQSRPIRKTGCLLPFPPWSTKHSSVRHMHNSRKTDVVLVKDDAGPDIFCRGLLAVRNADMPITARRSDNWVRAVK